MLCVLQKNQPDDEVCLPGHNGSIVAGHVYSPDGYKWTQSVEEPYTNLIDLADGTVQLVATRERPKLIFSSAGEPQFLANGACIATFCPPMGCVDCKSKVGRVGNALPVRCCEMCPAPAAPSSPSDRRPLGLHQRIPAGCVGSLSEDKHSYPLPPTRTHGASYQNPLQVADLRCWAQATMHLPSRCRSRLLHSIGASA